MAPLALVNGKIVTVDERFSVASAVALDGDRITAAGTSEEILAHAGPGAEVVDLGGRTVIPGLIDNHNHVVRATSHCEVRLEGVRSRDAALAALRAGAAELPPGQWLLTLGGWHEEQWAGDRRELTRGELDAVAGDRPAFIQAQYDHAVANTAWLDAAGVSAVGLSAAGVSAADESRATGRISGGLVALNRAAASFPPPADREAAARRVLSWYNSLGLTTVFDPGGVGVAESSYDTIRDLAARGELTLRVLTTLGDSAGGRGAAHAAAFAEQIKQARPFTGDLACDRIAVGEIYYAAFHWDHAASPPRPTEADITAAQVILDAAAGAGWPVQTHSVTPEGLDLVFDAYERANRQRPIRLLRWSVTHAEGLTAAHVERARRLGALRPGLLADLLILDRDYLTVPADEIKDITPLVTMVGGRVVHGSLTSLVREAQGEGSAFSPLQS